MSKHVERGKTIAEILADQGRPVTDEGRVRARRTLADGDARIDPDARAALLERLGRNVA